MTPLALPVHCSGEGCRAKTIIIMMGEGDGYQGGLFEDPGWTIATGESLDESGGAFICRKCFEKEDEAGNVKRD